ncbi:MAG: hypothetical protein JJT89_13245 [Nitriliruptoraceae bacterium]|nr:hypothetical protein [Nitriliruptoraceae bacterium]
MSLRDDDDTATPAVLAVDGNSLGHRAYHSSRPDQQDDERPLTTGAIVSMLATAWSYGPYDAVVIGIDDDVNQRKLDVPAYKAGRPPTPPELTQALRDAVAHLEACGFEVVIHPGAEADDVMAATVDAVEARDWVCDVLSSDRDLTALVGARTRLLRPRARFADLEVEDRDAVLRRYGVPPERYIDLAALRGDPSDGLVGAHGIGPKTAARLIRDHGSVLELYRALHELPPRIEASLREARERVERNLELMSPIPHLPVDIERVVAAGVDVERLVAVLEPLGLGGAAQRFARAVTDPVPALPPMPPPPEQEADHGHAPPTATRTDLRADIAQQGEQGALF